MEISSIITYNVHLLGLSAVGWSAVGWSFDLLGLSAMCCTYTPHTNAHILGTTHMQS